MSDAYTKLVTSGPDIPKIVGLTVGLGVPFLIIVAVLVAVCCLRARDNKLSDAPGRRTQLEMDPRNVAGRKKISAYSAEGRMEERGYSGYGEHGVTRDSYDDDDLDNVDVDYVNHHDGYTHNINRID